MENRILILIKDTSGITKKSSLFHDSQFMWLTNRMLELGLSMDDCDIDILARSEDVDYHINNRHLDMEYPLIIVVNEEGQKTETVRYINAVATLGQVDDILLEAIDLLQE